MKLWFNRNVVWLSRILQVMVLLASVRCIVEILRLQYVGVHLAAAEMNLYLQGALVAGIAAMAMTIISYYNRYRLNVAISVLTIIVLVAMKMVVYGLTEKIFLKSVGVSWFPVVLLQLTGTLPLQL